MQNRNKVDTYLLRLYHLRDVVWPLVEKKNEIGSLNLNFYMCGSVGCVIGWAATTEQWKRDGWEFNKEGVPLLPNSDDTPGDCAAEYLGISVPESVSLFGQETFGNLLERRELLDHIIEEKEKELGYATA